MKRHVVFTVQLPAEYPPEGVWVDDAKRSDERALEILSWLRVSPHSFGFYANQTSVSTEEGHPIADNPENFVHKLMPTLIGWRYSADRIPAWRIDEFIFQLEFDDDVQEPIEQVEKEPEQVTDTPVNQSFMARAKRRLRLRRRK